ncbi:hypothetical protein AO501_09850 [Mycobacterium gordonae]|uniref:Helix-turn-helix domain-containing protein n=1 Tax=Mycobacterium gordonae TaxID=1778 RepID=A0A0Q2QWN8_MYCGO|nr:hypothetical protein [Mycobacterium gordonae]KQH76374.1 hypothetical protein AO501_09850 [Mycobacterium gordonae]
MGHRYPIQVFGDPIRKGYTVVADELIRFGAHDRALGSDGLAVILLMLSRGTTRADQPAWETSASQISEELGWGRNRERASAAIQRAEDDGRLVRRGFIRDGVDVKQRCAYVICAGGRRFTDEELVIVKEPIVLPSKRKSQP